MKNGQIHRYRNQIRGYQELGRWRKWVLLLNGTVSVRGDESLGGREWWWLHAIMNVIKAIQLYTKKWLNEKCYVIDILTYQTLQTN